ncbi:hypothetical protein [Flavobacterium sp.]|uniref:hypothetical protein n=1 Tax=Flavobacterium sp. TaxID=239 RepID=UPI0039E45E29
MLQPLTQFLCDTCHGVIENPDQGWIEWLSKYDGTVPKRRSTNFRICHHKMSCQKLAKHPDCADLPLREFVGAKAAVHLASLLDVGRFHERDYSGPEVTDFAEFAELMRRLTIPYYEEARQYWNRAMHDGYFYDQNEIYLYLPDSLMSMIEHYQTEDED